MTNWTELDPEKATILERYPDTDGGFSIKIRHPDMGRPKIFLKSKSTGCWYWLAPKPKDSSEIRQGYVFTDFRVQDELGNEGQ